MDIAKRIKARLMMSFLIHITAILLLLLKTFHSELLVNFLREEIISINFILIALKIMIIFKIFN